MSSDANPLARHGGLSYLEIPAIDSSKSAAFYGQVLGWQIDQRTDDDFRFSGADGLLIGRWVSDRVAAREPGLVPFMYVDGLDAAVARVTANGGEVVKAPYAEGDVRVARIRDPAGNLIGLWQFGR
ncbi:MAG: Glyoxalase family protein [bacterium]|nr:Glyoxalase family protein [bacterium]